jgi:hypothetical protein
MPDYIPPITLAAPAVACSVVVSPEYSRLPGRGMRDPLFGLTRSYLNLLILPSKENDFRPLVQSSVIRRPGAKTGVRMIKVASLRTYLDGQFQDAGGQSVVQVAVKTPCQLPLPPSNAEFIRLPKPKERDPLFGLSRSFLNQLIIPCMHNAYRPPVRSHVLRRRGYRTGIRLISVDSLRQYIQAHEEKSRDNAPPDTKSAPPSTIN